jgi:hypothetical protein
VPFHKLLVSYAEALGCLLRLTFICPYMLCTSMPYVSIDAETWVTPFRKKMLCTSVYTGCMHGDMVYAFHNYIPFEKNIQAATFVWEP